MTVMKQSDKLQLQIEDAEIGELRDEIRASSLLDPQDTKNQDVGRGDSDFHTP